MAYATILGLLIIFALSISCLFNQKFENTIATAFFVSIILVYIFGLFLSLKIGSIILVIITIILAIFACFKVLVKKYKVSGLITTGLILFCSFSVLFYIVNRGRLLSNWDEFSHWGLVTKNLFYNNQFAVNSESTTAFKDYPPAISIIQYLFSFFSKSFNEPNLFRANNMLYIALLLPVFTNGRKGSFILSMFVILVPTVFYSNFFSTIYIDCLLGVLFFYIIYNYYFPINNTFLHNTNLMLAFAVLSLSKSSGVGLAFIAAIIISIDMLSKTSKQKMINTLYFIGGCFMTILSVKYTWDIYLKIYKVSITWTTSDFTISNFLNALFSGEPSYRKDVFYSFINRFFISNEVGGGFKSSYAMWFVLFIAFTIGLVWIFKDKEKKKSIKIIGLGLSLGFVVYCFSMLVLYMFAYSEYEARSLASIDRYLATYIVGVLLFFVFVYLRELPKILTFSKSAIYTMVFAIITPLLNLSVLTSFVSYRNSVTSITQMRANYAQIDTLSHKLSKDDRVYIISQADQGLDYWVMRYNLTPVKVQSFINTYNGWSIGEGPMYDGDIWTVKFTKEEWSNYLYSYSDYVYVLKFNNEFKNLYGQLFDDPSAIENNTLYSVVKQEGKVKLVEAE